MSIDSIHSNYSDFPSGMRKRHSVTRFSKLEEELLNQELSINFSRQ